MVCNEDATLVLLVIISRFVDLFANRKRHRTVVRRSHERSDGVEGGGPQQQ